MGKLKAYTYHHTHWDAEWYFTEQSSQVQLVYHIKELFEALDRGWIKTYHLDGKTSEMEDYFKYCPQDLEKFRGYVKEGKILIGPLYEQLSAFLAPGESVIKNLQIGMKLGDEYGGSCKTAYIPDSFGQIQDYPKIFNGMGIRELIFRRGMGDIHQLKNDFLWTCSDGSTLLTSVLQAGYSFAGLAFMQGRLIGNAGLNLDKKSILNQMKLCGEESAIEGEFLLPAGKDNCPVMFHFEELMEQYNRESDTFTFEETTLPDYMKRLWKVKDRLSEYRGELYTTQYHRVHKSIFSARPDIKIVQDRTERLLIYQVQPLMAILDQVGIPYERGLVEDIWKLLIRSQTHSEATNSDQVNEQILNRAKRAYEYGESLKIYLTRKIACSVDTKSYGGKESRALVVFNTLPYERQADLNLTVYTKEKEFTILRKGQELSYTRISQKKVYGGWKRKYREMLDSGRDYYATTISLTMDSFGGCSYETLVLCDGEPGNKVKGVNQNDTYIENSCYRIECFGGKISIRDKKNKLFIEDAVYFQDGGDQGDTFDYDYPDRDLVIVESFEHSRVEESYEGDEISSLTLKGYVDVPKDLEERRQGGRSARLDVRITFTLRAHSEIIEIKGNVTNRAKNHRLRLVVKTMIPSAQSLAGTQFGIVSRATTPRELEGWREAGWLEEPVPIEPLLNHVTLKGENHCCTVYTRSTKEYEIIGEDKSEIALTLYRSVGHFGLPDLNRRPGRASGIPECIMECPLSQMLDTSIEFDYGLSLSSAWDPCKIARAYGEFAVGETYFEEQEFDRVFVPMKYFEVNPLIEKVPDTYGMLELRGGKAVCSSIEKAEKGEAVLVRVFNSCDQEIEGGELVINRPFKTIRLVDFREEEIGDGETKIGILSPGEIRTYKIEWEG